MDADQAKDANMECTVIARMFDLVLEKTKKKSSTAKLPQQFIIAADNTTREAKNQHFQSFVAWVKARHIIEDIDVEFLPS
eukprot:2453427-Karenia_brevis.AAC.1